MVYPQLVDLCVRLSIEVSFLNLPKGHSGINGCYGDKRAIVVNEAKLIGLNREHALLHELREVLEYKFRDLNRPVALKNDLEMRAEMFAMTVRMHTGVKMWGCLTDLARDADTTWKRVLRYVRSASVFLRVSIWSFFPFLSTDQNNNCCQRIRVGSPLEIAYVKLKTGDRIANTRNTGGEPVNHDDLGHFLTCLANLCGTWRAADYSLFIRLGVYYTALREL